MNDDVKRVAFYGCLAVATALAALLRAPALAPDHLWLDDQWVAVLVRDASLADLLRLAPPAPLGFVLLLKAVALVFGQSPVALQFLPFVAGILLVPATGALALRISDNSVVALLAALLVAVDPMLAEYSVRVKPFAFDALATVLVACAFVAAIRRPSPRALATLALVSVASILVSFAALISGAAFLHLAAFVAIYAARGGDPVERRAVVRAAVVACAVFDAVALLVVGIMQRGHGDAAVFVYWSKCYLPLDDLVKLGRFLLGKGTMVFAGVLPGFSPRITAALAAGGAVLLATQRHARLYAVGIVAVFGALFAASALHRYPVGGGRTDLFAHPLAAVLVAAVIERCASSMRGLAPRARLTAAAAAGLAIVATSSPASYPSSNDREVIEHAAATVTADDTVIIYPWSSWAVALYAGWPVHLRPEPASTNGFYAVPDRPRTLLLGEVVDGQSFLWSPSVAPAEIDALLDGSTPPRIHLIATQTREPALGYIRDAFRARGYVQSSSYSRERATQDVFERAHTSAIVLIDGAG